MIAAALRDEIDTYAVQMRKTNPIFFKAADGSLDREAIARYLVNIRELLRNTPLCLTHARAAALARNDLPLASHYAEKLDEEKGHDAWADRDLEQHRSWARSGSPATTLPSLVALIGWIHAIIDEDPALYLGYILFAEYLIVLLGPEWLTLLETKCGIARSSMSVVGNHVVLDADHVEQAMDEIDELVGDPRKIRRMREVVRETIARFEGFCVDVCSHEVARVVAA